MDNEKTKLVTADLKVKLSKDLNIKIMAALSKPDPTNSINIVARLIENTTTEATEEATPTEATEEATPKDVG